jgi:hypothetical protein
MNTEDSEHRMLADEHERGFLGARVRTWQIWWYVVFFVAVAALVAVLIA